MTRWTDKDKHLIAKAQGQVDMMGNYYCKVCGHPFPLRILEVDHIVPVSRGGTDRISNLRLVDPDCNKRKGDKMPAKSNKPKPPTFGNFPEIGKFP